MTVELIEFLLGLYFIGWSITLTHSNNAVSKSVELFKLVLGIVLVILALYHGVRV